MVKISAFVGKQHAVSQDDIATLPIQQHLLHTFEVIQSVLFLLVFSTLCNYSLRIFE